MKFFFLNPARPDLTFYLTNDLFIEDDESLTMIQKTNEFKSFKFVLNN